MCLRWGWELGCGFPYGDQSLSGVLPTIVAKDPQISSNALKRIRLVSWIAATLIFGDFFMFICSPLWSYCKILKTYYVGAESGCWIAGALYSMIEWSWDSIDRRWKVGKWKHWWWWWWRELTMFAPHTAAVPPRRGTRRKSRINLLK